MNVERYIASGILEAYVFGELSEAEEQEVLRLAREHPEIQEELKALERTQEQLAFESAVAPPDHVRTTLLAQIEPKTRSTIASPVTPVEPPPAPPTSPEPSKTTYRLPRWVPVSMAAAVTWIILATGAAIYCWQQWKDTEEDLQLASAQNQEIAQQYERVRQTSQTLEQQLNLVSDPDVQRITLQGLDIAPDARAVVYWNPDAENVYLNSAGLPQPSPNQQYQLWAIVDGNPVSVGIIPLTAEDGLLPMQEVANASAFAITLEPLGGSESPTLEAMYVMGEV